MQNELSPGVGRTLNELRTIQYLEETVGPAGLRRRAAGASLELESIIEDWSVILSNKPRKPKPTQPGGLDTAEIVESFVEVKRSSAELLRRAAREAPSDRLRERLLALASEEDEAATTLSRLLPASDE